MARSAIRGIWAFSAGAWLLIPGGARAEVAPVPTAITLSSAEVSELRGAHIVSLPTTIGVKDAPIQAIDKGTLEHLGLSEKKLGEGAVHVAGLTAKAGTGLYLLRGSPALAGMAETLLPKGAPIQQIAAFLGNNPRATGVVVGITAAGYTLTAISEYATEDSTWKKHSYLWALVVGVVSGLGAWGYYAKKAKPA